MKSFWKVKYVIEKLVMLYLAALTVTQDAPPKCGALHTKDMKEAI